MSLEVSSWAGAAADRGVGLGRVVDGVLEEAVEEQADVAGAAAVEAERELGGVGVERVGLDGALVGAQRPALGGGRRPWVPPGCPKDRGRTWWPAGRARP